MPSKLPYMLSVGLISKIMEKIQQARRPDRFTQDFLETKLGHSGGSARAIIPLLKRIGFLGSDGAPTQLYDQFRNTETQGTAIAQGLQTGFRDLFDRNEYVYELNREKLTSLIVEVTGGTRKEGKTLAIVRTFLALNELADFEGNGGLQESEQSIPTRSESLPAPVGSDPVIGADDSVDLRVSYTINLNLPETTDPNVFNAIFVALRENLLKK